MAKLGPGPVDGLGEGGGLPPQVDQHEDQLFVTLFKQVLRADLAQALFTGLTASRGSGRLLMARVVMVTLLEGGKEIKSCDTRIYFELFAQEEGHERRCRTLYAYNNPLLDLYVTKIAPA